MGSSAPPIRFSTPQLTLRPQPSEPAPKADEQVAQNSSPGFEASMRESIAPASLMISYDESAGRFVQTLTDSNTSETLRRYPNDAQLAYSRAVMAYLRALADAVNRT